MTTTSETHQPELRALTVQIVTAYLANQPVTLAELPAIIPAVHQALRSAGQQPASEEAEGTRAPAVPIKRSVGPDHLICLEDGMRMTMLKRHLRSAHGMTPEAYRAKWGLSANYPMAPRAMPIKGPRRPARSGWDGA